MCKKQETVPDSTFKKSSFSDDLNQELKKSSLPHAT